MVNRKQKTHPQKTRRISIKARASKAPRGVVQLRAYDKNGGTVKQLNVPINDYYDRSTKMIDSNVYRKQHGILRITGKIFDFRGHLEQQFEIWYWPTGSLKRLREEHEDGTINDRRFKLKDRTPHGNNKTKNSDVISPKTIEFLENL
jgi:hypothetical protein